MKTPEDEAFDDLARRQGAWGGGFQAKRQAAMDKINSEFDEEYIKYREAFPKNYTFPAQEPVAWITPDGEGFRIRFSAPTNDVPLGWDALYTIPPKREWVGLEKSDMPDGENPMFDHEYFIAGMVFASNVLKEKNT
jgi:hypothetical protein